MYPINCVNAASSERRKLANGIPCRSTPTAIATNAPNITTGCFNLFIRSSGLPPLAPRRGDGCSAGGGSRRGPGWRVGWFGGLHFLPLVTPGLAISQLLSGGNLRRRAGGVRHPAGNRTVWRGGVLLAAGGRTIRDPDRTIPNVGTSDPDPGSDYSQRGIDGARPGAYHSPLANVRS